MLRIILQSFYNSSGNTFIPGSYISALTYCTNVEALFEYLLTLIDTSSEVKKIRMALASVTRQTTEPLAEAALKVKALTSSLLFMMNPNSTLGEVDKMSNYAAQDSIYSFVTTKTRGFLQNLKRTANQMSKEINPAGTPRGCKQLDCLKP